MLIEKNFLDFFPENKTLGKNLFDFFLNVNGKIQEKALNFDSYCNGGAFFIFFSFEVLILIYFSEIINQG